MLIANFPTGIDEIVVQGLTQWDKGQQLEIHCSDLPASYQVHFANKSRNEAVVIWGTSSSGVGTVPIPNVLLEQNQSIKVWVYITNSGSGETVKTINLPVVARTRPANYIATIDEEEQSQIEAYKADITQKEAEQINNQFI